MISVIINGCNGRMGNVVARLAESQEGFTIVGGVDNKPSSAPIAFPVFKSYEECNVEAQVIIDFSSPLAIPGLVTYAKNHKTSLLIATTGLAEKEISLLKEASDTIAVLQAANMSLGINLLVELVQKAATALGEDFNIEIVEKHHNKKKDSPSGTAFLLADSINSAVGGEFEYKFGRHTKKGIREKCEIGIHAIRAGGIVGEHSVIFAGENEIIELNHMAHSREIFASGALRAARFLVRQKPGFYSMRDVLNSAG